MARRPETAVSDSIVMLTPSMVELEPETFPAGWVVSGSPRHAARK